ncbi:MAG: hypothetical protein J7556_15070 [Acidovorax sp.]|nr:hypothetical protein [Acidovorax sp.]
MALIDEMRRQEQMKQGRANSFGDSAAASLDSRVAQIPTSGYPKAPAADGSQDNPLNTDTGRNLTNSLAALPGAAAVPGAVGAGSGLVARAFGAAAPAVSTVGQVAQAAAPYAPIAGGALALNSAANANTSTASPAPATAPTSSPTASPQQPRSLAEAALGGSYGSATPVPAPATSNVTRDGNSYSGTNVTGNITINGAAPGGGGNPLVRAAGITPGVPSQQNDAAAENLAGRQGLAAYALSQPAATAAAGAGVPLVQAAGIRHSGNDWQARKDLENAATAASSIMYRPAFEGAGMGRFRGGQGGPAPAVAAYQSALATDQALKAAQPGAETAAMNANAGLQREGMRQQGETGRSLVRTMLDQQRLGMEQTTQGFANRAAAQQEQLRSTLLDPSASQQQRQSAQQALMTLSGKQSADPYLVVPGGQHVDPTSGKAYNTPSTVFNRQTGQFVQQPAQGDGLPQGMTKQVGTSGGKPVYEDASGKRYVAG